ncbi:hypothetical protein JW865_08220 [Candidatus Bathyarchaeota archaeon]|nr:hypothetical protein [Candidatus Bathyarchaeota archaeon]
MKQYIILEDCEIAFWGNKTSLEKWVKRHPSRFDRIVYTIEYFETIPKKNYAVKYVKTTTKPVKISFKTNSGKKVIFKAKKVVRNKCKELMKK